METGQAQPVVSLALPSTAAIDADAETLGFSIHTAYYLAWASNSAYYDLGPWTQMLGLGPDTSVFTYGQFQGFVGWLEQVAVLAFRGTENIGNCLTDLETPLVAQPPYPGHVHNGFAEAVEQVWPEVLLRLGEAGRSKPVWVTGHSLGGAMATLASVRLAREGYKVRAVYTYGSPSVGDRAFRDEYDLDNYRFVNDNDLVPHLPFRWCYKHVGELKLLDAEGNLIEEECEWKHKRRELRGQAKRIQRAHRGRPSVGHEFTEFDWLSDHQLENYLKAIGDLAARVPRRMPLERPASGPRRALVHRIDPPSVPMPPRLATGAKLRISEEDLAAAFFSQPSGCAGPAASDKGRSGGTL